MRKKSLLSLVLTIMVMLSSFTAITFADNSKEQLSIDFTTDKKEYKQGEDINIEINIKNTSGKDLKEIEVKNTLPKGIELKSSEGGEKIDGSTVRWSLDSLKDNESVKFKLSSNFTKYQNVVPVPDTGMDYFNYLLVGSILLLISILGIVYIRKNPGKFDKKKATSTGMAIVMMLGVLGESLVIADASSNNSLNISKTLKLKCDGKELDNILDIKGIFVEDMEVEKPIEPEEPVNPEDPNDDLLDPDNPKWSIDTDNDGLSDAEEETQGTNINKKDTDGDGLSDYEEVYLTLTNPLEVDSNNNGINDDLEDYDNDGLSNIDEIKIYKTDSNNPDSDNDGLLDGEEITYKTDANKLDTDDDGLSDGDEVILGLDPLNPKTDGKTVDSNRKIEQVVLKENFEEGILSDENLAIPHISATTTGSINNGTKITISNNSDIIEKRSLIGKPIDIIESENIIGANISFEINAEDENIDELMIFRYNESTLELKPLDTLVNDKSTITTTIDELGTYCVLNTREFLKEIGINIDKYTSKDELKTISNKSEIKNYDSKNNDFEGKSIKDILESSGYKYKEIERKSDLKDKGDAKGQADIVFVIDTTGSMWSSIENVVTNINEFTNMLYNDYNVNVNFGLVEYKDITVEGEENSTIIHKYNGSNWFTNTKAFNEAVSEMWVDGGGDYEETAIDALEAARQLDFRKSADKFVILLTDADYKIDNNHGITTEQELIDKYIESGISLSVIAPQGEEYRYNKFYEQANGVYGDIYGDFLEQLLIIANKIGKDVSDGYWVVLEGFKPVKLLGEPTSERKYDTDKDGLSDYDELGKVVDYDLKDILIDVLKAQGKSLKDYTGPTKIPVYRYKSNPVDKDTDGDGLEDNNDPNKRKYDITDRTMALVAGLAYNNLLKYKGKTIGELIDNKLEFKNISTKDAELLRDWKITHANNSGISDALNPFHSGLGSVTISKVINNKNVSIHGLRGTEFKEDINNDVITDIVGGLTTITPQTPMAIVQYNKILKECSEIYLTGHSLGGRLVQDIVASTYGLTGILSKKPTHATTFNALGYNELYKIPLLLENNSIIKDNILTNYHYKYDLVGGFLGNEGVYFRLGKNITPWEARNSSGDLISTIKPYDPLTVHGILLWHTDKKLKYPNVGILN